MIYSLAEKRNVCVLWVESDEGKRSEGGGSRTQNGGTKRTKGGRVIWWIGNARAACERYTVFTRSQTHCISCCQSFRDNSNATYSNVGICFTIFSLLMIFVVVCFAFYFTFIVFFSSVCLCDSFFRLVFLQILVSTSVIMSVCVFLGCPSGAIFFYNLCSLWNNVFSLVFCSLRRVRALLNNKTRVKQLLSALELCTHWRNISSSYAIYVFYSQSLLFLAFIPPMHFLVFCDVIKISFSLKPNSFPGQPPSPPFLAIFSSFSLCCMRSMFLDFILCVCVRALIAAPTTEFHREYSWNWLLWLRTPNVCMWSE